MRRSPRRKQPGVPPATMLERQSQTTPGSHGTHVASIAAGKSGVCPEAHIAAVLIDVPLPEDPIAATAHDVQRHEPDHPRGRVSARRRDANGCSARRQHQPRHQRRGARRIERRVALARCLPRGAGPRDLRRRRQRRPGKGADRGRPRLDHGPHPLAGPRPGARPRGRARMDRGRRRHRGSIRERARDLVRRAGSLRRGGEAAGRQRLDLGRARANTSRTTVCASGTTLSIYNELYHPTNGANYIAVYLSPNLDPTHFRGIEAGVWKVRLIGEEIRDGRFNAWIERDDPGRARPIGGRRFFRFPSFFTEVTNIDSHSISSLACGHRVIAVVEPRRRPAADQRHAAARDRRATADSSRKSPRPAPTSSRPTASRIPTSHGCR